MHAVAGHAHTAALGSYPRPRTQIVTLLEMARPRLTTTTAAEEQMQAKLDALRRELDRPGQFRGRLSELEAVVRMLESQPAGQDRYRVADPVSLKQVLKVLTRNFELVKPLATAAKALGNGVLRALTSSRCSMSSKTGSPSSPRCSKMTWRPWPSCCVASRAHRESQAHARPKRAPTALYRY